MSITLVAAADLGRVVGKDNHLPWHLPADLKRFRALTLGKAVIMGRLTFESIGRPLPLRTNIVLSRDPRFHAEGCWTAMSLAAALELGARVHPELMIIGGAQVYREALPLADHMVLTIIRDRFVGDAWFPAVPDHEWVVTEQQDIPDPKHQATCYYLSRRKDVENGVDFVWPS